MAERPNVLFLMDDQHNARCLGCYGDDVVQTPTLDSLAAEGVRFTRAYTQSPICMPARVSYFTGRYPHSVGVYGNYGALDASVVSMAHVFRDRGYDTGAFGKLHLPVDWPTHGFNTRRLVDFADATLHEDEIHYYSYLKRVGYADQYDLGLAAAEYPHTAFVSDIPYEHSVEKWTADETLRWLRMRDGDDPFFAWTTFQRPHPPYSPPAEYADMYDPAEIPLAPQPTDHSDKPREWRDQYETDLYKATSEDDLRQVLAYYYSLITMTDEQTGRIIEYLRETGELENTIVVFAADHGDFAGEHGFVRKNVCISEAVHRVPMIWRYPEALDRGTVRDDLVESVDVFATLCDLLDIDIPEQVQGTSLTPALTGTGTVDRDAAFCEDEPYRTIRTDRWKLTYIFDRDEGELYDMDADPWEHDNLYDDPDYTHVKVELLTRLLDFFVGTEEPAIPKSSFPPKGETEAHTTWTEPWWETGEPSATPLHHLGSPGHPLGEDGTDE